MSAQQGSSQYLRTLGLRLNEGGCDVQCSRPYKSARIKLLLTRLNDYYVLIHIHIDINPPDILFEAELVEASISQS